jgi:hypothetical protein
MGLFHDRYYMVSWQLVPGNLHPYRFTIIIRLTVHFRFSDHPAIRTNPPYLAGERFAEKALSYVNADLLQPSLENTQFWGIMSCLEYGRASGSKYSIDFFFFLLETGYS